MRGWRDVLDSVFFFLKRSSSTDVPPVDDTSEALDKVNRQHDDIERRLHILALESDVQSRDKGGR